MVSLSAVIITYNEEKNIERCLLSLKGVVDEIVVVDSFSQDRTEAICAQYGVKFIQHAFEGHIQQKNWAITQASSPYVLSLDADEALSDELRQSILEAKNNWTAQGYFFNRLNNYCGQWIRHSGWYPDRKLRLWDARLGHRRAGKDLLALNHIVGQANKVKGLYWHVYPTYSQGKKALWDAMDSQGNRFIDAINGDKNTVDMSVRFSNGSKYQVIGSDVNPDSIRGANPIGVVFSEYSYMSPEIWDTVRPILSENKGWVIFLYTPNGHNHGYTLYDMALNNDNWYVEKLGVNDTGLISVDEINILRDEGVSEELIQQEYYCEFLEHVYGSYFSKIVNLRRKEGYIGERVSECVHGRARGRACVALRARVCEEEKQQQLHSLSERECNKTTTTTTTTTRRQTASHTREGRARVA